MIWLAGYILLLFVSNLTYALNLCPPKEDLHPCLCGSDGRTVEVRCRKFESVDSARHTLRALGEFGGHQQVVLKIHETHLDKMPSDFFRGLHVTKLYLFHYQVKEFGDQGRSAFEGLEDILQGLEVHYSFSEENELKYLNVSQMRAMEEFRLDGNHLKALGNEWFRNGPKNIQNLGLFHNGIEELGDTAFAPLTNLKKLSLVKNRFKIFKRSMLPYPAEYLWSLDLSNNHISSLPKDIFSGMPALKEIRLEENAIKRIPESTWSSIWPQLGVVSLFDNPLECDSHIEWMFDQSRPYILRGYCEKPKHVELRELVDRNLEKIV